MANPDQQSQIELTLRKEIQRRLRVENVIKKQSQALTETVDLSLRQPALPDFFQTTLRTITREFGGIRLESFKITHADSIDHFSAACLPLLAGHRSLIVLAPNDERISTENRQFFTETGVRATLISPFWMGRHLNGWIPFFATVPAIDDALSLPRLLQTIPNNLASLFDSAFASAWTRLENDFLPSPLMILLGGNNDLVPEDTRRNFMSALPLP